MHYANMAIWQKSNTIKQIKSSCNKCKESGKYIAIYSVL